MSIDQVSSAADPARWLVVYNRADAGSIAWAEGYRLARSVPAENLLGLDLPAAERISEGAFVSMRQAIADWLSGSGGADSVIGILCGHGVPGAYTRADGSAEAIAGQLQRIDGSAAEAANPLAPLGAGEPMVRPTAANLGGDRLTARIDGPTLADSAALGDRARALEARGLGEGPGGGMDATIWLDPYGPGGALAAPERERKIEWAAGLDRQRLRLPLRLADSQGDLAEEDAPAGGAGFTGIRDDAFFWGRVAGGPPADFFGEPAGRRACCVPLDGEAATAASLRDPRSAGWGTSALRAGYAAVGGGSRAISPSAAPRVRPFFEALRRGWTLGEAWHLSCPLLRGGLMLIGDPLLTLATPRAGWNVYGPFATWRDVRFDSPAALLRADERAWRIEPSHRPAEGARAIYLLRRVDERGRIEAGVRHARVRRQGDRPRSVPRLPAWPSGRNWRAEPHGAGWRIHARWPDRLGALGISRVRLVQRAEDGAERVLADDAADPAASSLSWTPAPAAGPIRYQLRVVGRDGGTNETPRSARLTRDAVEPAAIELL